jgi:hypothetical protein
MAPALKLAQAGKRDDRRRRELRRRRERVGRNRQRVGHAAPLPDEHAAVLVDDLADGRGGAWGDAVEAPGRGLAGVYRQRNAQRQNPEQDRSDRIRAYFFSAVMLFRRTGSVP